MPAAPAPARRRKSARSLISSVVLQEDPADGAAHPLERVLEPLGGERLRHHRPEVDEAGAEQLDDARPHGGRVPHAAEELEVPEDEPVGGDVQLAPGAGDPERDDAPALARQPRRELDRGHGAGGLDDEIELALVRRRPTGDVDRLGRAEPPGQLELGLAHAVGDDRGRRVQPREHERQRPERADADDPDRLARPRLRALEPLEHDRRRLDQDGRVERDVLRQRVHDAARRDHELAVAAPAGEAELVVPLAQVRLARPAAPADAAVAEPFADHAVAGRQVGDASPRPPRRRRSTRGPGCTGR